MNGRIRSGSGMLSRKARPCQLSQRDMTTPEPQALKDEVLGLRQALASQRLALLSSLLVSAWMVEVRDPYTGRHLWRVACMAHALALESGSTPREASRIAMAGFLHDLGQVGIPDAILRKPGRLSDEEFATTKTHLRVGARMLSGAGLPRSCRGLAEVLPWGRRPWLLQANMDGSPRPRIKAGRPRPPQWQHPRCRRHPPRTPSRCSSAWPRPRPAPDAAGLPT